MVDSGELSNPQTITSVGTTMDKDFKALITEMDRKSQFR